METDELIASVDQAVAKELAAIDLEIEKLSQRRAFLRGIRAAAGGPQEHRPLTPRTGHNESIRRALMAQPDRWFSVGELSAASGVHSGMLSACVINDVRQGRVAKDKRENVNFYKWNGNGSSDSACAAHP